MGYALSQELKELFFIRHFRCVCQSVEPSFDEITKVEVKVDLSTTALAKVDRRYKLKGLILAQNERWRRG
jgi:hypothetical protein